eukprot:7405945-Alexandrium_andersonii.AAC.1
MTFPCRRHAMVPEVAWSALSVPEGPPARTAKPVKLLLGPRGVQDAANLAYPVPVDPSEVSVRPPASGDDPPAGPPGEPAEPKVAQSRQGGKRAP